MKNILVTGGAGFIGSNFIQHLISQRADIHITNFDALTYSGNLDNLGAVADSPQYRFIRGDIVNQEGVDCLFQQYPFDAVVHFAAESHVDRSIKDPMRFIQTNIVGTGNLLHAALGYWEKLDAKAKDNFRFVHISTDEVFGSLEKDDPAFSESTPFAPNSPYAASKASSDLLVRSYFHTYGFPAVITNCSNNYGPYQFPEKLIPLMILNALNGSPLPVYGDGQQIRDWLYVEDHCRALLDVLEKGEIGETYNIGGGNQPANLEIVQTICALLDELAPAPDGRAHAELIQFVSDRPGHDRRYAMDTRKIEKALGWRPQEDLQSGLRKTVSWYLAHPQWVQKILERPAFKDWIQNNYTRRGEGQA
ncbi:MAG: dTDP-glucose 4,6-dehydratase [Chloroflexota bacterium]|nr:dTDP-glucose 4,6-dehydratase [Chloroflexota bacterium]